MMGRSARAHECPPWVSLTLLWMSGVCMRLSILVMPPMIPLLHADLGLSHTEVGVLSAMPSLLFAMAAIPGALLVSRLGAIGTVVAGMVLAAIASACRSLALEAIGLFAATAFMGMGLSIMQPAMPQLVRGWMPYRIGYATAVYMSGLLIGQVIAVWATPGLVLPLVEGSWRWANALWALPVVATAVAVWFTAPYLPGGRTGASTVKAGLTSAARAGSGWWPDWHNPMVWKLGFLTGSVNSLYFTLNFFLPDLLASRGESEWVPTTLTILNMGQIPTSFLMIAVAGRWGRRRSAYWVSSGFALLGILGMVFSHGAFTVAWAGLFGAATTVTFVLAFALPALLSEPHDVHRTAAAMLTISYSCAVVTPVVGGLLWDWTGVAQMAFAPVMIWPCVTWVMTSLLDLGEKPEGAEA